MRMFSILLSSILFDFSISVHLSEQIKKEKILTFNYHLLFSIANRVLISTGQLIINSLID